MTPGKIDIHTVNLAVGDKLISLTTEQTMELQKILNEMFQKRAGRFWWSWVRPHFYKRWSICGGFGNVYDPRSPGTIALVTN